MEEYIVNDALKLNAPEGFKHMNEETMKEFFHEASEQKWGIVNYEKQSMIVIAWTKLPGILPFDMILNMTMDMTRKNTPGYREIRTDTRTVGGQSCTYMDFAFESVDHAPKLSRVCLMKIGKYLYTVNITAEKFEDESELNQYDAFLDGIELV